MKKYIEILSLGAVVFFLCCTVFFINCDSSGGGGGSSEKTPSCVDNDADGYYSTANDCGNDCNDNDPAAYPGADEIYCDGIDNNCDGTVDENAPLWYTDCDGDGFAVSSAYSIHSCDMPLTPYSAECPYWTDLAPEDENIDCNDGNPTVYPGAEEISCDGLDNNCDDIIDEGDPIWYPDCDGDGFAVSGAYSIRRCEMPVRPYSAECTYWTVLAPEGDDIDCDDTNADVFPGQALFFETGYGDESDNFDYNCDSIEEGLYGLMGSFTAWDGEECTGYGFIGLVPECGEIGYFRDAIMADPDCEEDCECDWGSTVNAQQSCR